MRVLLRLLSPRRSCWFSCQSERVSECQHAFVCRLSLLTEARVTEVVEEGVWGRADGRTGMEEEL